MGVKEKVKKMVAESNMVIQLVWHVIVNRLEVVIPGIVCVIAYALLSHKFWNPFQPFVLGLFVGGMVHELIMSIIATLISMKIDVEEDETNIEDPHH